MVGFFQMPAETRPGLGTYSTKHCATLNARQEW